ncbi:MAG: FecR domain-containing protein [Balneolales bacterium]|nr:FecR domain-containing protein [Balneolales bacterium]
MAKHKGEKFPDSKNSAPDFSELSENERKKLEMLWKDLYGYDSLSHSMKAPDSKEIEDALKSVHARIDNFAAEKETISDELRPATKSNAGTFVSISRPNPLFSYIVAAAVLILTVGGYLLWQGANQPTLQHFQVPLGETASLVLPDGSEITLNSGSSVSYSKDFGLNSRQIILDGEAFFSVMPSKIPFSVSANGTITEVLGTSFNIRSWSDDPIQRTDIAVSSGLVAFASKSDPVKRVVLEANQASSVSNLSIVPVDPVYLQSNHPFEWRNNNLAFTEQPLSVIFREIERKFNITIDISNDVIANTRLNLFYTDPDTAESVIADICIAKGLRYARTSTGFRISM